MRGYLWAMTCRKNNVNNNGTSGQDRESYSDDQDRDSYKVPEDDAPNTRGEATLPYDD